LLQTDKYKVAEYARTVAFFRYSPVDYGDNDLVTKAELEGTAHSSDLKKIVRVFFLLKGIRFVILMIRHSLSLLLNSFGVTMVFVKVFKNPCFL